MPNYKETKVQTYEINPYCSICEAGPLIFTGQALLSRPPRYVYTCLNCGDKTDLLTHYPKIVYRGVDYV